MFYDIDKTSVAKGIPLMTMAPHYVTVGNKIPLQDSDTHTLAVAEFWGAERIVIIKRTDGIYTFDPYRGFVPDKKTGYCSDFDARGKAQAKNELYAAVAAGDMLGNTFSREGTGIDGLADGTKGHLMEDSGLKFMLARCRSVKEILVVHIAPEEMYRPIGEGQFKHITLPNILDSDPRLEAKGLLEQNLRNAFNGVANSRIVRYRSS